MFGKHLPISKVKFEKEKKPKQIVIYLVIIVKHLNLFKLALALFEKER